MAGERVLIVDDDAAYRALIRINLDLDSRFEVVGEAGDGVEAVELARVLRPDVVLLDISMPRMDGVRAADLIAEAVPEVQIVVLTAEDEGARAERLRGLGLRVLGKLTTEVDQLSGLLALS